MIPSCPSCGYDHYVRSVPALRAAGVSTIYGADHYSGFAVSSAGIVPVLGSATTERTVVSNLASLLAPQPPQLGTARLIRAAVLLAVPPLIAIFVTLMGILLPTSDTSTAGTIGAMAPFIAIFSIPSLVLARIAVRRARRNARIDRGRPAALTAWQHAFYCGGCHRCFWAWPPAQGIEVPVGQPLSPNKFRQIVWNVGGYAYPSPAPGSKTHKTSRPD